MFDWGLTPVNNIKGALGLWSGLGDFWAQDKNGEWARLRNWIGVVD